MQMQDIVIHFNRYRCEKRAKQQLSKKYPDKPTENSQASFENSINS